MSHDRIFIRIDRNGESTNLWFMEEPSLPTAQEPPANNQHNEALILTASSIITGIWGPLILYVLWKDKNPLVSKVGKSVINAEITLLILSIAVFLCLIVLSLIIGALSDPLAGIVFLAFWFLFGIFIIGVNIMITILVANKEYDRIKVPFVHFDLLK